MSSARWGRPAVAGVAGRVLVILGERASGRGKEEELSRGSAAPRSRRGGRGLPSKGCLLPVPPVPEDCGLVRDTAREDFGRSAGPTALPGALAILPGSLVLLVLGVVVLLLTTFCCV